jgi:hypothetical protein
MSEQLQFSLGTAIVTMLAIAVLMLLNFVLNFQQCVLWLDAVLATIVCFLIQERVTEKQSPIIHHAALAVCISSAVVMIALMR